MIIKNFICIDIGGSSIKSAIINSKKNIIKNTYTNKSLDSGREKKYILKKFAVSIIAPLSAINRK